MSFKHGISVNFEFQQKLERKRNPCWSTCLEIHNHYLWPEDERIELCGEIARQSYFKAWANHDWLCMILEAGTVSKDSWLWSDLDFHQDYDKVKKDVMIFKLPDDTKKE